jgi:hypothetical protein
MKRFQSLMTGVSAIALVAAFATPTFAAKTVIDEEELDEVTAAGQPKIAQAHNEGFIDPVTGENVGGDATAVNFQVNVFAAHIGGQEELTALTLNNIFGENQVANNVNIQAGSDNGGTQTNNAVQSWGSSKAHDYVTVEGKEGGAAICGSIGIIAKCHATGGDASEGKIGLLWEFADEIADSSSVVGNATSANVVITIVAGTFDEFAQSGLTALTVNNVFGFNQVANGLNISAGDVNTVGGTIGGAGLGTASNQSNSSEQWRGSPKGFSDAPTFF